MVPVINDTPIHGMPLSPIIVACLSVVITSLPLIQSIGNVNATPLISAQITIPEPPLGSVLWPTVAGFGIHPHLPLGRASSSGRAWTLTTTKRHSSAVSSMALSTVPWHITTR